MGYFSEQCIEIQELHEEGMDVDSIARVVNVNIADVVEIIQGDMQ